MSSEPKTAAIAQVPAMPAEAVEAAPPAGYGDFLVQIKAQIRARQFSALRAANQELVALWWLGDNISQRQATLGWRNVSMTLLHLAS